MARTFGKYRLLERIGGGGMAEVWRAEMSYTKDVSKTVALKMIREDLASVQQFHSLFIDEARITSRISHTNVAQVLDFGDENGRPFLAMELVKGADLHTLMAAAGEQMRQIPLDVAAFIMAEVARGLDHAHRMEDEEGQPYNVVHRDVSPQNVLLSYAGEVKVTDFGIARARDKVTQTETGTVMGKFRYMSPEQVRGAELDARSDIFSCGILLYELIAGRQLFDARTSAQVVDQIRYAELPELAASRPDADPALDTVLKWTLERDVSKRCPDAATLARDLERYVHVAHPQFTRDRVAELVKSLLSKDERAPVTEKGPLAYAGTERADITGPGKQEPERATRSLADLERESDVGPDAGSDPEPDTTARGKRGAVAKARTAATLQTGVVADGVPSESMEGEPSPPSGTPAETDDEEDPAPREETLTLARRANLSASQPVARSSAPSDAPTTLLDEGLDATGRTRARQARSSDDPTPDTGSSTETRTAGRAHGEAAPRPSASGARRMPRKRGRGVQTTLGVVLALLLLGVVALLLLRPDKPSRKRANEPGASAIGTSGSGPQARTDAGVAGLTSDGATLAGDAGAGRLAALNQAIDTLKPEAILTADPPTPALFALLVRLDRRLAHATVNDGGERGFGRLCSATQALSPPKTTAARLADLYAERWLLEQTAPKRIAAALTRLRPPAKPSAAHQRRWDNLSTLRVLHAPKDAALQEALILARGRQQGWCKPLAGTDGRRYLFPHVIVARDGVARLVRLTPNNLQGRQWRRYLEATPRGQVARLGPLALSVTGSRRQVLKKDDNRVFHIAVTVRNTDPTQPVKVPTSGFRLHGVTKDKPLAVGLWKPALTAPLAPEKTVRLELTFAAPLGPAAQTLVLSVPRAGAGYVWLQISSNVLR